MEWEGWRKFFRVGTNVVRGFGGVMEEGDWRKFLEVGITVVRELAE